MRLKLFTVLVSVVMMLPSMAQKISFEEKTVDFGTTLWKCPAKAVFSFVNKGREPLVITGVEPGCGCVVAEWSGDEYKKDAKGKIVVTYDAQMLGTFDRIISVHTNSASKPIQLRIKGRVSLDADPEVLFKDIFPCKIGDIMLSANNIEFPEVHMGDSVTVSFEILNNGSEVYTPQLMHLPSYIKADYSPLMLGRGKRGVINLKLSSEQMIQYGINQSNIYLSRFPGDKVCEENSIAITAVLLPELEHNSMLRPDFYLSSKEVHLGKLGRKSKLKGDVVITNKGTDSLKFESVAVFNRGLTVSVPKRSLAPGESMKLKVVLNAKFLENTNTQPRVLLITNDPNHQKETIVVNFNK